MTEVETAIRHRPAVLSSMEELIGSTPMLELRPPGVPGTVRLLAKLEMLNPLSSIKDRTALRMIKGAEGSGLLAASGGTVIETSSGNTGIALAALCAVRGHRCIIVLPDNATAERRALLRAFGAEIVLSDHEKGLPAAIALGESIQRSIPGSWMAGQHGNPDNIAAHYETTGPEIFEACEGRVDVLVCGVGTGGTLTGVARYLKERGDTYVVGVEPAGSPVLSGGKPGPHRIPGLGGGFINPVTDVSCIDEIAIVTDREAAAATQYLASAYGLLTGVSSGAAVHASQVLARADRWAGATVVTILPDTGERYLSLWDSFGEY
jgi:cysteine synthase A